MNGLIAGSVSMNGVLISVALLIGSSATFRYVFAKLRPLTNTVYQTATFLVLTGLLMGALGSPLSPSFNQESSGLRLLERLLTAGWWILAAGNAIGLLRLLIVLDNRPREARIISDLLAGGIYLATTFAIVNFVFSIPVAGLLATSGIFAIILGLALQSTLSDVFSGIAVGVERPYKVGDLLWVEGGVSGRVVEVNWRSTHIINEQNNVAIVPNSVIAKARLVNQSLSSTIRRDTISIRLDPLAMPGACMTTLEAALLACRLPLAVPGAVIAQVGLSGDGAVYEVSFSVQSSEAITPARAEIYAQAQRHLRYAGIALAVVGSGTACLVKKFTPAELLAQSELFAFLPEEERNLLSTHMQPTWLRRGDTIIRQTEDSSALFILSSGTAEVTTTTAGLAHLTRRLSPGATLGAVSLISGVPHSVTATALTQVMAYQLNREAFSTVISQHPNLGISLEALAVRGAAAINGDLTSEASIQVNEPELSLSKIRAFLLRIRRNGLHALT